VPVVEGTTPRHRVQAAPRPTPRNPYLNRTMIKRKEDFFGRTQEIKYFTRETDVPLTIGLLVDVSASQRNLIDIERQAAYQFFSQVLRKKDMAFLISFGEEAELLQDFTGSARLLQAGLDRLRVSSGVSGVHPGPVPTIGTPRGTVLYDAVYLAASDRLTSPAPAPRFWSWNRWTCASSPSRPTCSGPRPTTSCRGPTAIERERCSEVPPASSSPRAVTRRRSARAAMRKAFPSSCRLSRMIAIWFG
jgi:hypothetical protein